MRWIRHKGHSIRVPDTMQKVERDGYTKTPKSQDVIKETATFNWNASLIDEEAVEGFHHRRPCAETSTTTGTVEGGELGPAEEGDEDGR